VYQRFVKVFNLFAHHYTALAVLALRSRSLSHIHDTSGDTRNVYEMYTCHFNEADVPLMNSKVLLGLDNVDDLTDQCIK
jgi:hypothetical protein